MVLPSRRDDAVCIPLDPPTAPTSAPPPDELATTANVAPSCAAQRRRGGLSDAARARQVNAAAAALKAAVGDVARGQLDEMATDVTGALAMVERRLADPAARDQLLEDLAGTQVLAREERRLASTLRALTQPRGLERADTPIVEVTERLAQVRAARAELRAASAELALLDVVVADLELTPEAVADAARSRASAVHAAIVETRADLDSGALDPMTLDGAVRIALDARVQSSPDDPAILATARGDSLVRDIAVGAGFAVVGIAAALTGGWVAVMGAGALAGYGAADTATQVRQALRLSTAAAADTRRAGRLVDDDAVESAMVSAMVSTALTALDLGASVRAVKPLAEATRAAAVGRAGAGAGTAVGHGAIAEGAAARRAAVAEGACAPHAGGPTPAAATTVEPRLGPVLGAAAGASPSTRLGALTAEAAEGLRRGLGGDDLAVAAFLDAHGDGPFARWAIDVAGSGALEDRSLRRLMAALPDPVEIDHLANAVGAKGLTRLLKAVKPELVEGLARVEPKLLRALLAKAVPPVEIAAMVDDIGALARALPALRPANLVKSEGDVATEVARAEAAEALAALPHDKPKVVAERAAAAVRIRAGATRLQEAHEALRAAALPTDETLRREILGYVARAADPAGEAAAAARMLAEDVRTGGHAVLRHGPHISDAALELRVKSGIAPDGLASFTKTAGRYDTFRGMELARNEAKVALAAEGIYLDELVPAPSVAKDGKTIPHGAGEGRGGVAQVGRECAKTRLCPKTVRSGPIRHTRVSVEWTASAHDPGMGRWRIVQQFPDAGASGHLHTNAVTPP